MDLSSPIPFSPYRYDPYPGAFTYAGAFTYPGAFTSPMAAPVGFFPTAAPVGFLPTAATVGCFGQVGFPPTGSFPTAAPISGAFLFGDPGVGRLAISDSPILDFIAIMDEKMRRSELEIMERAEARIAFNMEYVRSLRLIAEANHVAAVPFSPLSLIGMPSYLPPGQMTAMHPFILHQQEMSNSSQSHVGNYYSLPISSLPQWKSQQGLSESAQISNQNQHEASQTDENITKSDGKYEYEISVNDSAFNANYTNIHVSHGPEPDPVAASSADEQEGLELVGQSSLAAQSVDHEMQHVSSQIVASLNLNSLRKNTETKEQNHLNLSNERVDNQGLAEEEMSTASASLSETSIHSAILNETPINNGQLEVC